MSHCFLKLSGKIHIFVYIFAFFYFLSSVCCHLQIPQVFFSSLTKSNFLSLFLRSYIFLSRFSVTFMYRSFKIFQLSGKIHVFVYLFAFFFFFFFFFCLQERKTPQDNNLFLLIDKRSDLLARIWGSILSQCPSVLFYRIYFI